jgi:hypothetical protein
MRRLALLALWTAVSVGTMTSVWAQQRPDASFDGTNWLVVWQEARTGSVEDICGARVTPSGRVLDPTGIPISTARYDQWYSAVSFDGTNYLVVWRDERTAPAVQDIYGARVTPSGTVLEPTGIPISTAADNQGYPAVCFGGTNYLVVWLDASSGQDIYGARVSPGGVVADSAGIHICWGGYPAVACGSQNYLVAWSGDDIYGARVSQAGTVLDTAGIPISTAANYQVYPAVSFDGTNFLVVWEDYRNNSDTCDIYGARVTPQGTVLDPGGIRITAAANNQFALAVAFDGTDFLVVWTDERSGFYEYDIYGARVTSSGTVLDPTGIPISTAASYQWHPAVSFDGTNFLVAWEDYRSGYYWDIYGARVSRAGTVLDPTGFGISVTAGLEEAPNAEVRTTGCPPTVVRGVLLLAEASSCKLQAAGWLLDAAGRKVQDLHSGPNDVSHLVPGVYFVRQETQASGPRLQAVQKVVITR